MLDKILNCNDNRCGYLRDQVALLMQLLEDADIPDPSAGNSPPLSVEADGAWKSNSFTAKKNSISLCRDLGYIYEYTTFIHIIIEGIYDESTLAKTMDRILRR